MAYISQIKSWNNGHFWTKTINEPLRKNVNFVDFLNFFFYSLESRFLVLEFQKRRFPGLYWLKNKFEKWPFLDQKKTKTTGKPLCKNFHFSIFEFLPFRVQKGVLFNLESRKRYFPGLYCVKNKFWKNGHFWTKTMG